MDSQQPGKMGIALQILSGIALIFVIYVSLATCEFLYKSFTRMMGDKVNLFPDTYASGSRMYTAIQNPTNPGAVTVNMSNNQRSGIEFSYSMFININSDTFSSGSHFLRHILHKGYNQVYPLFGPGIFCWGDKNTLRVYMNCYDTWNNYSDIDNIPVDKWFHLVVSCKGNKLYVYINGSLKTKMALSNNTPPYQNYGNIYMFSPRKITLRKNITTSLLNDSEFNGTGSLQQIVFDGSAKGLASRVAYFSYALTYTEIQALMNLGPSTVMTSSEMSMSPYLSDSWWANTY